MVLAELSSKLTDALRKMRNSTVVDETVLNDMLKEICAALLQADVDVKLVSQLRNNIKKNCNLEEVGAGVNRRRLIQKVVMDELVHLVEPERAPFKPKKGRCNVIMFVGLQGAGKTTTITKFGYYYRRKGWNVGLVCADTFRAGAFAQLKQNATKAKVAFFGSHTDSDPVKVAKEGVEQFKKEKCDIILVDTSGRHKQEEALFEEMRQISDVVQPDDVVFILDASIGQAARGQAEAFKSSVEVGSVVITKMDGHAKGGGALSAVAATNSPILFLGTGEHMEDLDMFSAQSFVSRLLGMGDMNALVDVIQTSGMEEKTEMMENLQQGKFSLRDMRDQYETVTNMGSLSKLAEMVPGMSQMMPNVNDEVAKQRIKKFLNIMDSMTDAELDTPKIFNGSRILRVARGAGVHPAFVKQMLEEHKRMEKLVGVMTGKKMKMGGHGAKNPRNMAMNAQQLAGAMNPQMLQQVGGMAGLQNMLKQMGGMEGLMKNMGNFGK